MNLHRVPGHQRAAFEGETVEPSYPLFQVLYSYWALFKVSPSLLRFILHGDVAEKRARSEPESGLAINATQNCQLREMVLWLKHYYPTHQCKEAQAEMWKYSRQGGSRNWERPPEAFYVSFWDTSSEEFWISSQGLFTVWEDLGLVTPHLQHGINCMWYNLASEEDWNNMKSFFYSFLVGHPRVAK